MNIHGQLQPSRLAHQVAKDIVLKFFVFLGTWHTPVTIAPNPGARLGSRRIGEVQRPEIGGLELHRYAASVLILRHNEVRKAKVGAEGIWKARKPGLVHITMKHFFLQRNINRLIRIAVPEISIVEGKQERIDKKHPMKPRGIEICSHSRTICK